MNNDDFEMNKFERQLDKSLEKRATTFDKIDHIAAEYAALTQGYHNDAKKKYFAWVATLPSHEQVGARFIPGSVMHGNYPGSIFHNYSPEHAPLTSKGNLRKYGDDRNFEQKALARKFYELAKDEIDTTLLSIVMQCPVTYNRDYSKARALFGEKQDATKENIKTMTAKQELEDIAKRTYSTIFEHEKYSTGPVRKDLQQLVKYTILQSLQHDRRNTIPQCVTMEDYLKSEVVRGVKAYLTRHS